MTRRTLGADNLSVGRLIRLSLPLAHETSSSHPEQQPFT